MANSITARLQRMIDYRDSHPRKSSAEYRSRKLACLELWASIEDRRDRERFRRAAHAA